MGNAFLLARVCGVVDSLDFGEIIGLSLQPVRFVALSDDSAAFIFACAAWYQSRYNWRVNGDNPTDSDWNDIQRLIGKMESEIMNPLVGLIYPHALGSLVGMPFLPCNGATYARSDYPILYSKLDAVYIIDADSFRVPDMRDRMPIGEGLDFSIDDSGGAVDHVLTESELAPHIHTSPPHNHSEGNALPALADLGTGVPVPSATPSLSATGFASVSIDSAGGGQAHNNMPPYLVVRWAIIAG